MGRTRGWLILGACLASVLSVCALRSWANHINPGLVTPRPQGGPADPNACVARVRYTWDVSSIPDATGALWELKVGSDFTNPTGADPGRAAYGTGGLLGEKVIDLRNYGSVFNGTGYFFRVVAKQGNHDAARRSDSSPLAVSVQTPRPKPVVQRITAPVEVTLHWNLPVGNPGIARCSDRVFYEVKKGSDFTNPTGEEPGRLLAGVVMGTTGSKTVNLNLQEFGYDYYYFRIVAKYGGNTPRHDVAARSQGVMVDLRRRG